jgi:hypothetical protein
MTTVPDDQIVMKLEDIRALKLCSAGCRNWLVTHGLSWTEFISGHYTAQQFLDTGDGLIVQVVEQARRRVNGE